ncbi:MAG: IS66 family transposase [Magnetococcales bacterium]|nr:IS66 family transposase [Magnetococcales bacterium]
MKLHKHDLRQMDENYLDSLELDRLRTVSKKLLADLKEAHERLDRNPQNSSVPPSSRPAYMGIPMEEDADQEEDSVVKNGKEKEKSDRTADGSDLENDAVEAGDKPGKTVENKDDKKGKTIVDGQRKAGKQPGSPGYGRIQVISPNRTEIHRASQCAACGEVIPPDAFFKALTGFYVIDIIEQEGQWGIGLECTLHHYGETSCLCGHLTKLMPNQGKCDESEGPVTTRLNEWRLIGPRLASFIVFLTYRMRLSRAKVREFLQEWFGLRVATGTIDNCLREVSLALFPVYLLLLDAIPKEPLVHADETPWKEKGKIPWLWVFISGTIVLFVIGKRRQEVPLRILTVAFAGWLMSDGLGSYRIFSKRLRCLAHLIRKARGLFESLTAEGREFGDTALTVLEAVLDYRLGLQSLEDVQKRLISFRAYCQIVVETSNHQKTLELAKEFLNDWDAIWKVVEHPTLPATNNVAERILRHWVIARQISHGTRTEEGSRAVAILASVIETGRLRGIKIWDYLTQVIMARRRGEDATPMPLPVAVAAG